MSAINILLLVWVAITGLMIVMWLVGRRRARRADGDEASAEPTEGNETGSEVVEEVPHPALVGAENTEVSDWAATTTDTLELIDVPVGDKVVLGAEPIEDRPTTADAEEKMKIKDPDSLTTDGVPTLTDVLEGIRLPYDLAPITSMVEDPDRHLIFLTTHSNAAEVGRRMADELERIGFEFEPVEYDQAVVTRGDDVVSMKLVPDADQVDLGNGPRYGAAGRGDVALEMWIGRSATPPSDRA